MADHNWTRLTPFWKDTVLLLANLISGSFLDCLLSKKLLTYDQYEELESLRREKALKDEVARDLLRILKKKPYPSFDDFWTVLDTEIDGGSDVRRQLLERLDTPHRANTEGVEDDEFRRQHKATHEILDRTSIFDSFCSDAEIRGGSDSDRRLQLQHTVTLSSSSETAAATAVALPTNFLVKQRGLDAKGVEESHQPPCELVFIEVVQHLRDKFKLHESTLKAVVLLYLEKAYLGKKIKLEVLFPTELSRKQQTFSIDAKPKIRILFPDKNFACFETNHKKIKTHLCRIMDLRESDLEIGVTKGSVTLIILVPGQGFINMLVYLGQNAEPLKFLIDVDKLAKVSFGDFPYVSVSVFSRKCLPGAAAKGVKPVTKVLPTVSQQESHGIRDSLLPGDDTKRHRNDDERLCQLCDLRGRKKNAEFVCTKCTVHQYYCGDCAQFVHKTGKRKNHAYQNLFPSSPRDKLNTTALEENQSDYKPEAKALKKELKKAILFDRCRLLARGRDLRRAVDHLQDHQSELHGRVTRIRISFQDFQPTARDPTVPFIECEDKSTKRLQVDMKITKLRRALFYTFQKTGQRVKRSALHCACLCGYLPDAMRLLDSGYNVDAQSNSGETPLIAACKTGHLNVVKFLLSKGCNIHLRDTWGRDALHHACANGYVLIAEFLIDCGSNPNTVDFKEERTALISACFNDLNGSHEGVVRLLVAKGCDVLAKDRSGFPAFFYVTKKESKRLARFILETGCPQPRESDDKRFCQVCDLIGKEKTEATFFCTKCKGAQYFCDQCVEESHSKIEHWKQEQGVMAAGETYHSLMIGVQNPAATPLPTVLNNLEHLLDDEDDEKFLEGFVTFGGRIADRLRQAVKDNKEKGVGLAACLRTFLVDLLVRRERLSMFTELLCCFHDKRDDSDIPEEVLDLTAKDVAIALLETILDNTKLFVMKRLDSMGYPLPLCYFMKPANQPPTCIANFGALSSVLPGSSSPLILSCGTFNTVGVGKTFLLKELISRLSSSIDIDLLDDGCGPTHDPSIDLILEKKGKGDFNYADIHGWSTDSNFADVVATLASVSYLIFLHVFEDDVKDLKSHEPSAVRFLLKEQLRSAHAILVVLIRDTENEKLREEAETEFRKAFPSGREVISILVKNLKSEKGSRLDRVIKAVLQRLEAFFNPLRKKELQVRKLKCPPSEYLDEIYKAKRRHLSPPRLRMRTSLGEALVKALTNTYEENKSLFSKLFPFTIIKSKIAKTHAREKEIIEAKNKHEKYIKECEEERRRLKTERVRVTNVAEPLKLFAHVIKSNDPKLFAEFQHYLEEWKTEHTDRLYKRRQRLHKEIKQLKLKKNSRETSDRIVQAEEEYRQNSSALDEIDVSVDSFWSEIMHMYNLEAKNKSKQLTSIFALAPATVRMAYLDYLKQGFAMQLLQGRPLQMAGQFMRDILRELDRQESSKKGKELFVVSVIGEQSSGKSTLLNSLFGCGFSTAAGKCTKGLFASYLKLSTNKSLLVLDSEGLLSIEGGGRVFDGQITLLALACSDLVIINHKGEISSELNDLLQVSLYAMDTLKVAKIKPSVAFVLRDQRDRGNKRVHQVALLKMQEAIRKAVSTSSKDVDDLIEIGSDSLFLLHSAFSETTRGTSSVEIPSLKFSRETFRLCKKIIQSLEKGNIVHTALKRGSTSLPLSDWYTHASYVWKTVTKHGHSLLYCKTVQEICLRQELGDIANEVVKKELKDESKGFKMHARLSFDKFLKELNRAESEDVINRVGRQFNGQLEEIMDSAIKGLQHKFDEMTAGKQYEEFKVLFKNSLGVPVRHEYDFEREKWKMKEDHRKQELHLTLTSRFFLERTKEVLKSTKFQRALSTEEAEALFRKQWEEFEPKAMTRLGVKKSMDETKAEVYRLFAQVAASTKYIVGGRSNFVTMPQTKLFSKQNGLFLDQDWAKYVNACSNKSVEKKGGSFIVSMLNAVVSYFAKPEDFVHDNLEAIKSKVNVIVKDLVVSLTGPNTQPFGHKLVKATIDKAVSVTEKAEESFSPKDGFQFLTTQFMTDFVITLVNKSINSLLAQQKRNEERAKIRLLEDKKDQRYFLAVLSKDKTDLDKAKALATLYEKGINLFIGAKLDDMKVKLKKLVKRIFGRNHETAARRAYDESFGQRNFENVVMYCMDASRFLPTIYSKSFKAERDQIETIEGKKLIRDVNKVYALLVQACHSWQTEVTKGKFLESSGSLKRVVKLSDFEKWLKESSDISENCLRTFPELGDYEIGRADVLFPRLRQELEEIQDRVLEFLELERVPKILDDQKRHLWRTKLRGCPHCCPLCGVKCEGESDHTSNHTVSDRFHVFPSFNQWGTTRGGRTYVDFTMCLDPELRSRPRFRGDRRWNNLDDFLKEEHPDWLPFPSNPHFAQPSPEIKEAWVNCRRALIYLRNSIFDDPMIDDTPQDWIDAYEDKLRLVTEEDVERLRKKLQEEV